MKDACSAYIPRSLCRNGFPYHASCVAPACSQCGAPRDPPPCMNEDIHPRWLDDSGKPRYIGVFDEKGVTK